MTSTPAKSQELQQPLQPTLDAKKAEVFAQKMLNVLNNAGVALMVSIGHRTRLFEVMSKMLPSSSTVPSTEMNWVVTAKLLGDAAGVRKALCSAGRR